jgi:LPXTG-motif cell wall-anchored protein
VTTLSRRHPTRTLVAALPLGLAALLGAAPLAHATQTDDSRAVAHQGNVDAGQKGACATAGLAGEPVELQDADTDGQTVTIESVPDGTTVTGIVVKGGPAYNVYVPGERGLSELPVWDELRSPLNNGGNLPQVSHWFACGVETVEPSESTAPSESEEPGGPGVPSESEQPEETTTPRESETTGPSESSPQPTASPTGPGTTTPGSSAPGAGAPTSAPTTSSPAVVAADTDELASTGFGASWLIWIGGLLLLAGGAVLALLKIRSRA